LQDKVDCDEFVYLQIGSVVGAHIGTGAVGMGFYQL
jgi:fatty acid-binding protein DegV